MAYTCDWTNEFDTVCADVGTFATKEHEKLARDAGWGWYENAHIRWTSAGKRLWFCPVHATVFKKNHGWGNLEDYGPPTHWWKNFFRKLP